MGVNSLKHYIVTGLGNGQLNTKPLPGRRLVLYKMLIDIGGIWDRVQYISVR